MIATLSKSPLFLKRAFVSSHVKRQDESISKSLLIRFLASLRAFAALFFSLACSSAVPIGRSTMSYPHCRQYSSRGIVILYSILFVFKSAGEFKAVKPIAPTLNNLCVLMPSAPLRSANLCNESLTPLLSILAVPVIALISALLLLIAARAVVGLP